MIFFSFHKIGAKIQISLHYPLLTQIPPSFILIMENVQIIIFSNWNGKKFNKISNFTALASNLYSHCIIRTLKSANVVLEFVTFKRFYSLEAKLFVIQFLCKLEQIQFDCFQHSVDLHKIDRGSLLQLDKQYNLLSRIQFIMIAGLSFYLKVIFMIKTDLQCYQKEQRLTSKSAIFNPKVTTT